MKEPIETLWAVNIYNNTVSLYKTVHCFDKILKKTILLKNMSTTLTKNCFYIDLGKIGAIDKLAPSMTKIHVSQLFMDFL